MKIDNSHTKVIFEFSPANYFLVETDDETAFNEKWSLNYRIDRSEKGKDDDVGMPRIYLSDQEAEECRKAGFIHIQM